MERLLTALFICLAAALWGIFALKSANDPLGEKKAQLEEDLNAIFVKEEQFITMPNYDLERIQRNIASKPKMWQELIPPPPPPPKKAVKAPKKAPPPDVANMLLGVTPTRRGMRRGGKMYAQIKTPKAPAGKLFAVGDKILGTTIVSIDRQSVTFSVKKGGRQYKHTLDR